MEENVAAAFLQLRNFKSYGRQPARVQHMKITEKICIRILTTVFLYFGTPSQYRRRWDFLLRAFEVGSQVKLTPGGFVVDLQYGHTGMAFPLVKLFGGYGFVTNPPLKPTFKRRER